MQHRHFGLMLQFGNSPAGHLLGHSATDFARDACRVLSCGVHVSVLNTGSCDHRYGAREGIRDKPSSSKDTMPASTGLQRLALSSVRDWRILARRAEPDEERWACWARGLAWAEVARSHVQKDISPSSGGTSAVAGKPSGVSQVFSPLASSPPGVGDGGRGKDRTRICVPDRRCTPQRPKCERCYDSLHRMRILLRPPRCQA